MWPEAKYTAQVKEEVITEAFTCDDPESQIVQEQQLEEIQAAVEELDVREQFIIRSLYLTDNPKSFEEVARDLGISTTRVAQLRDLAIDSLQELLVKI